MLTPITAVGTILVGATLKTATVVFMLIRGELCAGIVAGRARGHPACVSLPFGCSSNPFPILCASLPNRIPDMIAIRNGMRDKRMANTAHIPLSFCGPDS